MAGKKQHFVPQFLQKGFSSKIDGEKKYTYVYRAKGQPYEDNIKNVGFGNHFYSDSEDTTLDDEITIAETHLYSKLLKKIRESRKVEVIDKPELINLLSHFEIRSRNIRISILETIKPITALMETELVRPEVFKLILKSHLGDNHPLLTLADQHPEILKQAMDEMVSSGEFQKVIKKTMADSHRKVMLDSIEPQKLNNLLSNIIFEIHDCENFPLGDSMVIHHLESEGREIFKTLLGNGDALIATILPISSSSLLIGSSKSYTPDFERIKLAIAECSSEFFIASKDDKKLKSLTSEIGKNLNLATDHEIQKALADIKASLPS